MGWDAVSDYYTDPCRHTPPQPGLVIGDVTEKEMTTNKNYCTQKTEEQVKIISNLVKRTFCDIIADH